MAYWINNSADSIYYRDLRPDYVRSWYIFSDANAVQGTNGILDPGDTYVTTFQNWWTMESANTQYNYRQRDASAETAGDYIGAPMVPVDHTNASNNFWLEREKDTIQFYLTYSQFDNVEWPAYTAGTGANYAERKAEELALRNRYANGWAMAWVINDYSSTDKYDQTAAGRVKMDIFVHDGKLDGTYQDSTGGTQATRSNPAVATSNDVSIAALDKFGADIVNGQIQVPNYTGLNGADIGYLWSINEKRFTENYGAAGYTKFLEAVASMEVYETDPTGLGASDVIYGNRSPNQIAATLTDGNGNAYLYQDAFLERDPNDRTRGAVYAEGSTDGGVLKGLGGYNYYDPNDPNKVNDWGEQQVIRIDFDTSVFSEFDPQSNPDGGSIKKIIFWDFGDSTPGAAGTQQTDPVPIVMFVDLTQTVAHGQVFYSAYDANGDPIGPRIYFPENRIYIATVTMVPEPVTMVVLAMGGMTLLLRRKIRS
ncbi:MAG TPA: hypothetical protein DCX07_11015 [Phycisphaerales bacterium]|nr:hypothetical protein [Phycisphaerales bacterium]